MLNSNPITVRIAQLQIAHSPAVFRVVGLGSCVVISLYDPDLKLGGLCHAMLPYISKARRKSRGQREKFVDSAIPLAIDKLVQAGAMQTRLVAKLVGGAQRLDPNFLRIGWRNVLSARDTLKRTNIPIIAEDIGKEIGRTVLFDLSTGQLTVFTEGSQEVL